jgi:hypothetical protein
MSTKTTVIYHSADFDGLFCREIARKFLGDSVEYIGWDFADKPLTIPDGKLYVMDLPIDRVFGFEYKPEDVTGKGPQHPAGLIWIDHHKSSIATHPSEIDGYRIDGVSACRLAWQWFNQRENPAIEVQLLALPEKQAFIDRAVYEPYAVQLAGEYDIWDHRNPDAKVFQFGLRSRDLSDEDWKLLLGQSRKSSIDEIEQLISAGYPPLLNPDGTIDESSPFIDGLLRDGRLLQRYQKQLDADAVTKLSFLAEFEGLKFLALNTTAKNSQAFEAKDVPETGHDALLKFNWTGEKWDVSMYHARHRTDLDLSVIASKHGGCGHRGACGFRAESLPFVQPQKVSAVTKLPDGSGCFTATVMSKEEAMALPLKKRPICYRISSEMYIAVFEAIGSASMTFNADAGNKVFNSEAASKIAVDLCFKIAEEKEKACANVWAGVPEPMHTAHLPADT